MKKLTILILICIFHDETFNVKSADNFERYRNINETYAKSEAFYVANSQNTTIEQGKIQNFDKVIIDIGDMFNPSTSTAKTSSDVFYWFALSVTSMNYLGQFDGSGVELRQDPRPQKSVTTQIEFCYKGKNNNVGQLVQYTTEVNGDNHGLETSWLGFRLKSPVSFTGLSNKLIKPGPVIFSEHTSNSFDYSKNGRILTDESSYYYISYTVQTRRVVNTILLVNDAYLPDSKISLVALNYMSTSSASKGLIVRLEKNDALQLQVTDGMIISSEGYNTIFSIISLNSSTHFTSVVRQNDFIALEETEMVFQTIRVNYGDSWDLEENHFKCKSSGLYKISLSLGARYNYQLKIEILKNQDVIGKLESMGTEDGERRAISRSNMIQLLVDDTISVRGIGVTDVGVTSTVLTISKIGEITKPFVNSTEVLTVNLMNRLVIIMMLLLTVIIY